MDIKPIETTYNGYRFRSRLEARWAVFFDTLGIAYEYEKEGFELGELGRYLPDFWLPNDGGDSGFFVEIKAHRNLNPKELARCYALALYAPVVCFMGAVEPPRIPTHLPGDFLPTGSTAYSSTDPPIPFSVPAPVYVPRISVPQALTAPIYHGSWALAWGQPLPEWRDQRPPGPYPIDARLSCWHERDDGSLLVWPVPANEIELYSQYGTVNPLTAGTKYIDSPRLLDAYTAARSARFEHGERGRK